MDRTAPMPGAELDPWREAKGIAGVAVGVPTLIETIGAATWVAPLYGGPKQSVEFSNPFLLGWDLFGTHSLAWSGEAWAGLATVLGGAAAGVVGSVLAGSWVCHRCRDLWSDRREADPARAAKKKARKVRKATGVGYARLAQQVEHAVDAQARWMAQGAELADLTYEAMVAKAARLGVRRGPNDVPGVSLGRAVLDSTGLYASYEDLHVDIMGPRAGKSSSLVIPAVMEAIGPVVATSNKRDVVDATRLHRSRMGTVRVFDPQGVAKEPCSFYWDPIAWVAGTGVDGGAGAHVRAVKLAGHFAAGGDADKGDPFFEPEGEDLLAGLILAAALDKKPITKVFEWITKPKDDEPIDILVEAGYSLPAGALRDQYNAPDRQRKGVFSTAKKMASCLKFDSIVPWVCPPKDGEAQRESFDVVAFARSRDTLYPLSLEGAGTAGPLITALTAAVVEAAADAGTEAGGRLPVPMMVCLDEAANIVKWAELPKMYSHFGSRGIIVQTILQSWAQGVRCWGSEGMQALWGAANIRILGPGLADAGFLRDTSELIGQHYEQVSSLSNSRDKSGTSTSTSWSRTTETTLTVSDLAALPSGRAVLLSSGRRPTLLQLVPWWQRPYADAIKASQARFEPTPADTTSDQEGDNA